MHWHGKEDMTIGYAGGDIPKIAESFIVKRGKYIRFHGC